jgi:tripartite-type tricarboxylate transporter receptor subunit TctC
MKRHLPGQAAGRVFFAALSMLAIAAGCGAQAQQPAWPTRPVKFVMPFPPGGGSDIVARVAAQSLSGRTGQPFVVENVAGAAGNIGTQAVIRSTADGYTLLFTPQSPITIAGSLEPKPPFDASRDLLPVAMVARTPTLVVVHPSIKANTLKELAALTRANRGKYFFGSPGEAHEFHLAAELVLKSSGADMTHIPYKGMGPAIQDTVAGRVQLVVAAIASVKPFIADGRLRALAAIGPSRFEEFPNVPSTLENGLKDITVYGWFGVFAPAGTPRDLVDRIAREMLELRRDPGYAKKMKELSFESMALGPAEFARELDAHRAQWKTVIQTIKLTGQK